MVHQGLKKKMIARILKDRIEEKFFKRKAIILTGPRQVGKTTLMQHLLGSRLGVTQIFDGDDGIIQDLLNRPNTQQLKQIIANSKIIFIDEAQRIPEIGLTSKIIADQFPDVQLILSGSSSFELVNKTNEPLTGRKWTFNLWPITWEEWQNHIGFVKSEQDIENRLVFGFYPDVLNNEANAALVLSELTDSYLYKDVLMYGNLKKPNEIRKLLQALAYQVGNEVSYTELSQIVGVDPKTVERYIDILEKAFILFRLNPLSKNLRNEIKAKNKIYFYDNGVRNAVIGQLQPISVRQDIGALWENFLVSEREKQNSTKKLICNTYFWRTMQQQEVDYVEETNGNYYGFEFKWNQNTKIKFPKTFVNAYDAESKGITRGNFRDFVIKEVV